MTISSYVTLVAASAADLDTQVAAAIGAGKRPWGARKVLSIDNGQNFVKLQYEQAMVEGAESATFEDLDARVTTAEGNIDDLEAETTQAAVSVTATTGGGTTGLIPATANFVEVTSDDANKQISLPAATVGKRLRIKVGATGCELISAVAAHQVNDVVVGATNEAALVANAIYLAQYVATNKWVLTGHTSLGAAIAAIVPDAL